ncbi:MAG: ferredoxin family protein [Spirochaetales bacterium]|nr:ferredoxin family protein [Spirochaetales bacterium]
MKLEMKVSYYPGDTGKFISVDEDKCTGCGECAKFCMRGVWQPSGNIYRPVNLKSCAECGACWNVCGYDAVIFEEPRGGTGIRFIYG